MMYLDQLRAEHFSIFLILNESFDLRNDQINFNRKFRQRWHYVCLENLIFDGRIYILEALIVGIPRGTYKPLITIAVVNIHNHQNACCIMVMGFMEFSESGRLTLYKL